MLLALKPQTVHNCSGARTNEHCVAGCGAGFQGTSVTKTCHSSGNFVGADPTLEGRLQNLKVMEERCKWMPSKEFKVT